MVKKFTVSVAQKAAVDRYIAKWQPLLFMNQWHIKRAWSHYPNEDNSLVAAVIDADSTYRNCIITFYPRFFDETPHDQENNLLHELCHCVTQPMKDIAHKALVQEKHVMWHQFKDADERTTTHVANALFALEWHMREEMEDLKRKVASGNRKQQTRKGR